MAQTVKSQPAVQETWVQSLGWEDPLEEEMATHSSNSCLENPMDRGAWQATVHGVTESDTTEPPITAHSTGELCWKSWSESHSVVSDSLWPHGLYSPWDSPGQNTEVGSLCLIQGSSQLRHWTQVSWIEGGFFTSWANFVGLTTKLDFCVGSQSGACSYVGDSLYLPWYWVYCL